MTGPVLIVVTHLLGTGHLSRALTLARAFAGAGHATHLVSGRFPVPHLEHRGVTVHQLPPLRSDGTDFSRLLTSEGRVADPRWHAARRSQLLDCFEQVAPSLLITELFPFGRRNLAGEFTALLERARQADRPVQVLASIRDILAPPSKPAKAAYAEEMIARHYDGVLVHSDPAILPLERSWPVSPGLARSLRYTGFVAPPLPPAAGEGAGEVLVSAGGGAVGDGLFAAALDAAAGDARIWRLLVGGSDARRASLRSGAPSNIRVEPPRADFRARLRLAAASVSMCGYNTAMDLLQTGVPAVVCPFDAGGELEQSLRADALADLPGIVAVPSAALTGAALASALETALAAPPRSHAFRFDGAAETVRICTEGPA